MQDWPTSTESTSQHYPPTLDKVNPIAHIFACFYVYLLEDDIYEKGILILEWEPGGQLFSHVGGIQPGICSRCTVAMCQDVSFSLDLQCKYKPCRILQPNGANVFCFVSTLPLLPQPPRQCLTPIPVISLLFTKAVSPVLACLSKACCQIDIVYVIYIF